MNGMNNASSGFVAAVARRPRVTWGIGRRDCGLFRTVRKLSYQRSMTIWVKMFRETNSRAADRVGDGRGEEMFLRRNASRTVSAKEPITADSIMFCRRS